MGAINIPVNLQEMFQTINDRLNRLELGYNGPQATADSANTSATAANAAAALANTNATTAIALAGTKNTVFYSGTAPTANAVNDQWIDTALGNKLFLWNGTSWISAQDAAIAAAQTSADGKNHTYYATTAPTTPYVGTAFVVGDLWFNTASGNAISTWNGTSWVASTLGDNALASLSASKLTAGTIDASIINVSNINAGNITTGVLSASRIATGSLNGSVITSGTITATQIAAGTITATQISSSYVYAGTISANNITAGTLSATVALSATSGTIGGFTISGSSLANGSTVISSSGTITSSGLITSFGGYQGSGGFYVDTLGNIQSYTVQTAVGGFISAGGHLLNPGYATTTSSANVYMNSGTGLIALVTSSQRYKVEIEAEDIPVQSILSLTPKSWVDKVQYEGNGNSSQGLNRILGVIAEDVAEIPVLSDFLMNKNEQGQPDSVNYDRIAVALLPLLKDHEARLNKLEGK